jgi:hypothetical protein
LLPCFTFALQISKEKKAKKGERKEKQLLSLGQLTNSRRLDGAPEPDGALRESARTKMP